MQPSRTAQAAAHLAGEALRSRRLTVAPAASVSRLESAAIADSAAPLPAGAPAPGPTTTDYLVSWLTAFCLHAILGPAEGMYQLIFLIRDTCCSMQTRAILKLNGPMAM